MHGIGENRGSVMFDGTSLCPVDGGAVELDPSWKACEKPSTPSGGRQRTRAAETAMSADNPKRQAAAKALEFVEPGMRLGLGTGSTAAHFVDLLGEKVRAGPRRRRRAHLRGDAGAGRAARHSPDDARRDAGAGPDHRRRRRARWRAAADQRRRGRAAAREDRGLGSARMLVIADASQARRRARPLPAAGRDHPLRHEIDRVS